MAENVRAHQKDVQSVSVGLYFTFVIAAYETEFISSSLDKSSIVWRKSGQSEVCLIMHSTLLKIFFVSFTHFISRDFAHGSCFLVNE